MKHLLFLFFLILSMTFGAHGQASAASRQETDKVQKIEQKENSHDAVINDASNVYRICNGRPQRFLPSWLTPSHVHGKKLPYYHKFHPSLFEIYRGKPRRETAPFHFDVASKYYVICLRHLLC